MTRSKKHYPLCHCAGHDNAFKKIYNRRIRRAMKNQDVADGSYYKKLNCSWEISDWPNRCTWEQYKNAPWHGDSTEEEKRQEWERWYERK